MAKGVATSYKIRELVIKSYARGNSMRKIAKDLNLAKSTIGDIIKNYGARGNIEIAGKSTGRPRIVTERMRRSLVKVCKSERRSTLREITAVWNIETGASLSRECCRKWIHKSGMKFYKVGGIFISSNISYCVNCVNLNLQAKEKPLLTAAQKKKRLAWAKEKASWTHEQWSKVIFSDESKFDVSVGDSRKRVIRSKNEAFHKDCLKRTVKFPRGVMIWGCMSSKGLGNMQIIDGTVNAEKYQQILENSLLPSVEKLHPDNNFIFQQDGASCHTAKTTKEWFHNHRITILDWPSSSPDLNVIENLWHKIKRYLRNCPQRTTEDLKKKIQEIWNSFGEDECSSLVLSMPKRIAAVIKAKGDVTPY